MQFEVIRKSHKKEVVIGVIVFVAVIVVLLVRNSFAKYQTVKNLKIAEGTINYTIPDFKVMAMYKNDGNEDIPIDTMPESGYKINTEKSYCTTDNVNKVYNKVFTNEEGKHVITGLSKDSKCYIYFDKEEKASDTILVGITVKESPTEFTSVATTDEGVFKAQDDDGDTYYWRGAVENNYVKFADKYWRIIRINGDGTIRMITNSIGTSVFNDLSINNNNYVGFKYTTNQVHGNGTESEILKKLNTWYNSNLKDYESNIDINAGFCNDREPSTAIGTSNGKGGTGTTNTYYGAYIRLSNKPYNPSFKCKNESDLFTKVGATKKDGTANGNRALTNPIGLITADEVVCAGGLYGVENTGYYLYTGMGYWTMSPYWFYSGGIYAPTLNVSSSGMLGAGGEAKYGVRPVINLKADTKFTYKDATTKGTMNDPYVVE